MKRLLAILLLASSCWAANTCASGTIATAQCMPVIYHPWNHGGWAAVHHVSDQTNNEITCYSPDMVTMHDGAVYITATNQPATCNDAFQGTTSFSYKTGFLIWYTYNIRYGTIEVRTKISNTQPRDAGVWAEGINCQAVDLVNAANIAPCNWPNAGSEEIDIAEARWPGSGSGVYPNITQNMLDGNGSHVCYTTPSPGPDAAFHTYKVVFTPSGTSFYIDGTQECTSTETTSLGVYLKLSLQITGPITGGIPGSDVTDYVRVLDQNGNVVFYDNFTDPVATSVMKPLAKLARFSGQTPAPVNYGPAPMFAELRKP